MNQHAPKPVTPRRTKPDETEQPALVKVRRQPGDYRLATYPLEKVLRMRWGRIGGGIRQRSATHVYGYVQCNELIAGKLAHSCRHGPPPHEIKVCITKKHNEQVWPRILEIVGPKPKRPLPAPSVGSAPFHEL